MGQKTGLGSPSAPLDGGSEQEAPPLGSARDLCPPRRPACPGLPKAFPGLAPKILCPGSPFSFRQTGIVGHPLPTAYHSGALVAISLGGLVPSLGGGGGVGGLGGEALQALPTRGLHRLLCMRSCLPLSPGPPSHGMIPRGFSSFGKAKAQKMDWSQAAFTRSLNREPPQRYRAQEASDLPQRGTNTAHTNVSVQTSPARVSM